ncbi:Equilibrative nucleoside transporter [Trinorchestia longiramus]|nr:Equilibrative nucleoside transporter [Trinorchestia longiramus]
METTNAPVVVTLVLYVLGIAALLPWNFFITADTFWQYKLRNVSLGEDWDSENATLTNMQVTFMPSLVVISNLFCSACLIFTSYVVTRVREVPRMMITQGVMLLSMGIITIFAIVDTDQWQSAFYVIVLILVAVLNAFEAVFQGSLYGITGQLPSACTNALVSGMAWAGIFSSIAQIISLAIGDADPIRTGIIYFSIADVFILLAIGLYYYMSKILFYKNTLKAKAHLAEEKSSPSSWADYWRVFKKVSKFSFTTGMSLLVTLAIFPAVQVYVTSNTEDGPWKDIYFQPTITFLLFNIGDLCGRELPRWLRWPGPDGWLLPTLCCSRVLIALLIMFCYGADKTFPTLFYSDGVYIFLNLIFGITNGYFGCLPYIYYPPYVEAEEKELAGTIMGAVMGAGMVIGSLLSPAFVALWGPRTE